MKVLSWKQLWSLTRWSKNYESGPTCSQATRRPFGQPVQNIRVTLFRDNHAWCPYCQKVWLFLEEKQIPYNIAKVTMRCYGPKERWYLAKVPNGMLPALELDGRMITESDEILAALEAEFGPLGAPMRSIRQYRQLERSLFGAWCQWLCYPSRSPAEEQLNEKRFRAVLAQVGEALTATKGPFFLEDFSLADVIFIPYVERMVASLFYYKGFDLKETEPALERWFKGLEQREAYRGVQSDAHTHCHDLPPQMGGCYENGSKEQQHCKALVDMGPWVELPDCSYAEPEDSIEEALARTLKHRESIIQANCIKDKAKVDDALRFALTTLTASMPSSAPGVCGVTDKEMAVALLYVRDRINVPRDMSIWAARRLRQALSDTAATAGYVEAPPIPMENRFDQLPAAFRTEVAGG